MKSILCVALMLGFMTAMVGCSEETPKKMSGKSGNGNGNGSGTSSIDEAAKKASDTVAKAGQDASKAVSKAGEKAKEEVAKAGETAKETVAKAGEKASEAAEKAKESAGEAMDAISKEFSAATDKAKTALADVPNGSEILTELTGLFTSAKESLQGVTDSKAAQAASVKLGELDGKIDALSAKVKTLPEGAKTAIAGLIDKGIEQLKALSEKAKSIPNVGEVIQPKLDALIAKLGTLKE